MFELSKIKKAHAAIVWFASCLTLLSANTGFAGDNEVNFALTDHPGRWFDTGIAVAGNRSIAIAAPGVRINFSGNSNTVHTRTSLIYPTGAAGMPFNTKPKKGGDSLTLTTPDCTFSRAVSIRICSVRSSLTIQTLTVWISEPISV